ncbi:zinc finger CCHC domain-containing protein 17 [Osmia lignaria lignaria]|uniref:zinc finger CCHC domain-containing protein 17 n=1 Tax=Osmia lignaria lignaria TaxID=1437193 RepID=UPI0014788A5A|nr:nucleolar protein of 40 kDa-like [Osmia lignaria]
MANCKLNEIFLGEIASVQNYGAFIRIPGCSAQGLIHKSQVSSARVDDVAEILQKGERVWCKIISIGDDGKIGLSMKYVNQGSGTDLDPNGVELQRDTQKRKTIEKHERKTIHLEAVLNTTCTKCGTAGHLSKDCFMSPGGKKYELIPEIEEEQQPIVQPQTDDVTKKEKKHKEKRKKKRKVKKLKQNTDDSDSDRKEIVKKKKKKYSKDQKRKRKKHNNSFSDESSNESLSSHDVKAHKRKHSDNSIDKHSKKSKHSKSKHSTD